MKYIIITALLFITSLHATQAEKEHSTWKDVRVIQDMIQSSHRVIGEITPQKLFKKIDDLDDFILIDIREPGQRGHGDIPHDSIVDIVRGYLEFKIENLVVDKKTPLIVYCCSGSRSILAARTLMEMGYKDVHSLQGGIQGWTKMGLPLATHYGEMIKRPDNYVVPKE